MTKIIPLILTIPVICFFASCSTEKEDFQTDKVTDYVPKVGKSITYRLDSTVFLASGTKIEVHSYLERHKIISEGTDNLGQKIYTVQRELNNVNGTGSWVNNGNYRITNANGRIETIDNDLRVMSLQMPMKLNFSWKGNSYLPQSPYQKLFDMTTDAAMNQWEFTYTNFGDTTINGSSYQNVWTIVQNDEVQNIPPEPNSVYGHKDVSVEKYAKGIGLIYKDFQLYEYQGGSSEMPTPYYVGFGVTMWIVDHN
ncbi:MAG: hypothetical protein QM727_15350 [Niabella sp.]